ncbi:MAG: zinc ribbon domain-containing protein [Lentisphaerae bacterium]|nr:zinc ribbon domain-containing protein [Lentisphaerota bacterium]
MAEKDNYYLLLELPLDPPVRDKAKLEAAINAKQAEWNKKLNSPLGVKFSSYVAKLPAIKEALLRSDIQRDEVIAEAEKIIMAEIAETLDFIASSGFVTEAQLKDLCKRYPQYSEASLKKMIKVPVVSSGTFKAPEKPADPPFKPVDSVLMGKIQSLLGGLSKSDIYDFLGCPRTTSSKEICELASQAIAKVQVGRKTPEASATQELAGLVKSIFAEKDGKAAYDYAHRRGALTALQDKFALLCKTSEKSNSITWEGYQSSIALCRSVGMSAEEAEYAVYDYYCNKKKCPPPVSPENASAHSDVFYCKSCLAPNPKGAKICQKCGLPFKVQCPQCGKTVGFDSAHCDGCSFPVGDMPLALRYLEESKLLAVQDNWTGAEKALKTALIYWPGNKECLELQKQIAAREAKIHLENLTLSGVIKASVTTDRVSLSWPAASARDPGKKTDLNQVSYQLMRKRGGSPSNPQDGEILTETRLLNYDDTTCVPGVIYGYAVFPVYDGCASSSCVVSPRVMTVADVFNLKIVSDDKEIRLQWENPQNCSGVKCVRKLNSEPRDMRDGEEIPLKSGAQGLVDTGLKNKQTYGYRICAVYTDPDGKPCLGVGIPCSGTPAERPEMLNSLRYVLNESNAELSWTPLKDCTVRILVSQSAIAETGAFLPETDPVFARSEAVRDVDQVRGVGNWRLPGAGIYYLTPVVCKGGNALVGQAIPVVPCVSNVKVRRQTGNIEVSWDWPRGCGEVRLVWRNDKFPESPFDGAASQAVISKSAYDSNKAHIIRQVGDRAFYFNIYTTLKVEGKEICSAPQTGVSLGQQGLSQLTYSIVRKKKFLIWGNDGIELKINVTRGSVPELILLRQARRQPLSKMDGSVCLRIPASNGKSAVVPLPPGTVQPGMYVKLFLADDADESKIKMIHPAPGDMKI